MYQSSSFEVTTKYLLGIKALEIQLPTRNVSVPDLPTVRGSSVNALLNFNRGTYKFPERFGILVSHITAADTLGADEFLEYVGRKLCLPIARFDLSNDIDTIYNVVRDRYRLARVVKLKFPPSDTCYVCKLALKPSEIQSGVDCCSMEFHRNCLKGRKGCPYCRTPWISLRCCVCGKTCTPTEQFLHDSYASRMFNRMSCCSADTHDMCRRKISGKCPACLMDPKCVESPHDFYNIFWKMRWNLRQTEAKRKRLVTQHH